MSKMIKKTVLFSIVLIASVFFAHAADTSKEELPS